MSPVLENVSQSRQPSSASEKLSAQTPESEEHQPGGSGIPPGATPLSAMQVRTARFILITSLIAIIAMGSGTLLLSSPRTGGAAFVAISSGLHLLMLWVLERWPTKAILRVIFVELFLVVTLSNIVWSNALQVGLGAYTVLIMVSGLMLGKREVLVTAISGAVVTIALLSGLFNDLIARFVPVSMEQTDAPIVPMAASLLIYYSVATAIIWTFVTSRENSFQQKQLKENELQQTIGSLKETDLSKNYFDKILRSMSNVLIVAEPEGKIRSANPAALRILGYNPEEIVGKRLSEVFDFDASQHTFAHRSDDTFAGEAYMIGKNGQHIPVTYTRSVLRGENRVREGMIVVAQDNRERVAAEQERAHQATRFRALFEQTNDAIFLLDLNGSLIAANRHVADLIGYSVEELLKMNFLDFGAPQEQAHSEEIFRLLQRGQLLPPYERTFIHKNGTEIPVEISISVVQDAGGTPLHLQSVVRDIRERKAIERRLRYQAGLLENVSDAIISTDMDYRIVSWNRAAEIVYGWYAEEVIGRPLHEVIPSEYDGTTESALRRHFVSRGYWRGEAKQFARDGRELIMLSSVTMLRDGNSTPLGMVIVSHDITQRKIAEREREQYTQQLAILRQLDVEVNSSLDLQSVLHIGLQAVRIISDASAGFVALMNNEENDEQMTVRLTFGEYDSRIAVNTPLNLIGSTASAIRLKEPRFIPDVSGDPDYVVDVPDTRAQMVFPLISQAGLTGVVTIESSRPETFTEELFDFLRIVTARIAIALDNAELYQDKQRQLEELTRLYERVKNLEALKTDMIRMASHDLRGPLGVVKGYTEILLEDLSSRLNEPEREYFETMRNSLGRMQNIVSDILSNQRIEEMADRSNLEIVDMALMTQMLISHHEHLIAAKKQKLITHVDDAQMLVQIDSTQLREAMANLFENAVKYTPERGTVQVNLERCNDMVVFKIEDNGPGIPKEQQPHLFEAFYRAQNDHNKGIEGTGLGLNLVKGVVERGGGRIIFESVEHQGSVFGFELPLFPGT
jgi:PAS domain S-box-containing protein